MKTRNCIAIGLALFGLGALANAENSPSLPTEFTFTLEARSGAVTTNKFGFTPPADCCPPVVRRYRQQETWNNINLLRAWGDDCGSPWWTGTYWDHDVKRMIPPGEVVRLVCEGSFNVPWANGDDVGTRDCNGWTVISSWEWGPATNTFTNFDPCYVAAENGWYFWTSASCEWSWWGQFSVASGVTLCGESVTTNIIPYCTTFQNSGEIWESLAGTNISRLLLSDEFTTPELIAAMPALITEDWHPSGNKSPVATALIDPDEQSASGTAVQARFKVFAPVNERWEINYTACKSFTSNTVVVVNRADAKLKGIGTGGWIYTNVDPAAAFSTRTNGDCVYYQGESSWIEASCGSGLGCAACGQTPGSTVVDLTRAGARVGLGLGAAAYGDGSASLLWMAASPNPALTLPSSLEPFGDYTGVSLVRADGLVRQVLTPAGLLADITNDATSLTVSFYSSVSGSPGELLPVTGLTPFAATTIAQGSTTNDFLVTVSSAGGTRQYALAWSPAAHGWTLNSGNGLRVESRTWDESTLTLTTTLRDLNNQIVSQQTDTYRDLAGFGRVPVQQVKGPGTAYPPTTRWFYYDNPATDGTNYGSLRFVLDPGGAWRRYEYDSLNRLTNEVAQFLNAPTNAAWNQSRATTYDYTSLDGVNQFETRTEWLLGTAVGRTVTVTLPSETRVIRCANASVAWTDSANLVTATRFYATGANSGKVLSVSNPDATLQTYDYQFESGLRWTTVCSGAPDATGTNVAAGVKTMTRVNADGSPYSRDTYDLSLPDAAVTSESYDLDDLKRVIRTWIGAAILSEYTYDCCGLASTADRQGTVTTYLRDALKRRTATVTASVTTSNVLDAAGNILAACRIGTDGSVMVLHRATFDTAGRLLSETNGLGGATSYAESRDGSGQTVKTITYPDGGQRVETYCQDGSLRSVTGSAAFAVYYTNGVAGGEAFTEERKNAANGSEWTRSYTDFLGRSHKTVYAPGTALSQSAYNNLGQLVTQVNPDTNTVFYTYNSLGRVELTVADVNHNGVMDTDGPDRVTRTATDVFHPDSPDPWAGTLFTRTRTWQRNDANAEVLASETWNSGDGSRSASIVGGLATRTETTYDRNNGERQVKLTAPDGTFTVTINRNGTNASAIQYDRWSQPLQQTSYACDSHGRLAQAIDVRNGASSFGYNDADLLVTNTTPAPAPGASPLVTLTFYDRSLRPIGTRQPDGSSTTNLYFQNGLLQKTWGSRTYPVQYTYDYAGRMKTLKTWQSFAANSGTATTTWNYNSYRGWLDNKRYADNRGPTYTYTAGGRLRTRAWARGITTTYGYNSAGELTSATYSDSTPAVSYGYDRRGRQTTVTQGGVTTTRAYGDAGNLLSENYSGGPLDGLTVTNTYDEFLRRTNVSTLHASTLLTLATYSFDPDTGRLQTVSDGTNSATYYYLADSGLVDHIDSAVNGQTVMTTTKTYDYLNRLASISSINAQPSTINSFSYAYNSASQRTAITNADGSYWAFTYDSLGQVTSGRKYWSDNTPVAGQQFEYSFDDIGNRKTAGTGGNNAGANLHYQNYTANTLNQYTSRTVPGYAQSLGSANADATVTLWGSDGSYARTVRHGDYFAGELQVHNTTNVWLTITNLATLNDGSNPDIVTNATGNALIEKSTQALSYDYDGNLTADALWVNSWDAENRRTNIQNQADLPSAARAREQWAYLPDGRWIQRIVSTWSGSAYVPQFTNRYVWDGQVLLAVLDYTNGLAMSFLRGLDLSGTVQGGGGAGGVLAVTFKTNGTHFVSFDGNGNIVALVSAADGTVSAEYERGPFGETIVRIGQMADANPLRFSTQYADDVTGDLKYLYRDCAPLRGGWLSRDPLQEDLGGENLFSLVINDAVNGFDPFGLQVFDFEIARAKNGAWGEPREFFEDSSGSAGSASATTTLIGHGPSSSYCCNTPHRPEYADNLDAGSITAYMTGAPKGTYLLNVDFKGNASVNASNHDKEDPYFPAGAVLKFSASGQGQLLYGSVSGPAARAQSSWTGSKSAIVIVSVRRKSDRVEIAQYRRPDGGWTDAQESRSQQRVPSALAGTRK